MAGWHHPRNGHGFVWTPGVNDGREAWSAALHGVAKSRTWLSNWTELNLKMFWWQKLQLSVNSSRQKCLFSLPLSLSLSICFPSFTGALKAWWLGLQINQTLAELAIHFFWCSTYSFNKCRSFGVCTSLTGGNRERKVKGHALGKRQSTPRGWDGVDAASLETQALCSGLLAVRSLSCYPRTVASQAPLSMGFPGKCTGVVCHSLFSIYIWE